LRGSDAVRRSTRHRLKTTCSPSWTARPCRALSHHISPTRGASSAPALPLQHPASPSERPRISYGVRDRARPRSGLTGGRERKPTLHTELVYQPSQGQARRARGGSETETSKNVLGTRCPKGLFSCAISRPVTASDPFCPVLARNFVQRSLHETT